MIRIGMRDLENFENEEMILSIFSLIENKFINEFIYKYIYQEKIYLGKYNNIIYIYILKWKL